MTDIRDDSDLKTMVYSFYDKVQKDERLGYIFNDYAFIDWDTHLPKMVDFWSNIVFRTGRYSGRPFMKHISLPIQRNDFNIWYGLFVETVDEHFVGEKADFVKKMAWKIANTFTINLEAAGKFEQKS